MNQYSLKTLLFLTSVFLFFSETHAQHTFKKGFIITNSNDTLFGLINLKSDNSNGRECEFKETLEKDVVTYTPGVIKGYRIDNNKYYISKEIIINKVKKSVFLEFLLDGVVDLYYLKDFADEYYFIEKNDVLYPMFNDAIEDVNENDIKYLRNSNQYLGVLTYVFQDASVLTAEIPATEFRPVSLINITEKYHNLVCDNYKCIKYEKQNKPSYFVETFAGLIGSRMEIKTASNFAGNLRPFAGVNLRFTPDRRRHRFSFLTGLNYSSNNFRKTFEHMELFGLERSYQVYSKYTIIRLPMVIQYSFSSGHLKPTVSVGFTNIFIINPDYYAIGEYVINPETIYYKTIPSDFRKYQFGICTGLGFQYSNKNRNYAYFNINYEYRIPGAKLGDFFDYHHVNSILVNIGYGFKLGS